MKNLRAILIPGTLALVLGVWAQSEAYGTTVTMDLQSPSYASGKAMFNLFVTFPGGPGDSLQVANLSVFGSSSALTAGDTDFSRFAFEMDSTILAGWEEFAPLSTGRGFYAPTDPVNGPFIGPDANPQRLGQIVVDLSGLASGSYFVTLALNDPDFGTDLSGVIGDVVVYSVRNSQDNQLVFAQPDGVPFRAEAVVPEPLTLASGIIALAAAGIAALRRRRAA